MNLYYPVLSCTIQYKSVQSVLSSTIQYYSVLFSTIHPPGKAVSIRLSETVQLQGQLASSDCRENFPCNLQLEKLSVHLRFIPVRKARWRRRYPPYWRNNLCNGRWLWQAWNIQASSHTIIMNFRQQRQVSRGKGSMYSDAILSTLWCDCQCQGEGTAARRVTFTKYFYRLSALKGTQAYWKLSLLISFELLRNNKV